ncbi:hypothetical protein F5Y19DRAFT_440450 [Xylariaceae sp. FL1651]|nr:hypothetical protein F5Y19DRAFT_440450 [Xylariaceae sp. FL1651]
MPTGSSTGMSTGSGASPSGSATGGPSGSASGGASGTATSSPSGTASNVPGITNLPAGTLVILGVIPDIPAAKKKRGVWNMRRQVTTGGFVGNAGPVNPDSCDQASLFGVEDGQLLAGGQDVATDPGVAYMAFKVMPSGTISTTFSIVNGVLHWYNDAFTGGEAGFCQTADGQVFITFQGDAAAPANCNSVTIVVYMATQCVDGQIVPGSGTGGSGVTSAPSGGATNLPPPQEPYIFVEGQAPDDVPCYETTETWIPGEPTFLPSHNEL